MAPWPEQGSEPKAPDKTEKRSEVVGDSNARAELDDSSEVTCSPKSDQNKQEEKEVLSLDEGQLKALLDEAITYKNPKDREGKSELFKELLQEAEADETDNKGLGGSLGGKLPRAYYNLPVRRRQSRHGAQNRECGVGISTTRGGSLQNLHALGMDGGRRSRRTLVSARQREGGSLPTNVNVDNDPDLDMLCPNYTSRATLEVSGPEKEDNASCEEASTLLKGQSPYLPNGNDTPNAKEDDQRIIETVYASSISVGPVESGAMLYPSTPVQHVSVLSIPPSQIHAGSDANTRMAFGNTADGKPKSVDENGNALACVRMDSNCLDRKKQRRVKAKNDRNTILSDEIEGFRGGADIDTLMEYIESPSLDSSKSKTTRSNQPNGTRGGMKVRAKEEEPRSLRRRKDKFQRCNSLEEISKTKLEDLTEESANERLNGSSQPLSKKQVTLDDAQLSKKSSWDEHVSETNECPDITKDISHERSSPAPDSEFHLVTKKQRKKKKRTGCSRGTSKPDYYTGREVGADSLLYQYRGDQDTPQPRRKSASSVPPSDKSDSSDLDSVHSLPVSSTSSRTQIGKNSASGGSTPQASYADIARSMSSPPDGNDINIYRQDKVSPNTSVVETHVRTSTVANPMLPIPLASFKKDAMTDTNCDRSTSILTSAEYPPLDIKPLCLETIKRSRSAMRDSSVATEKVNKTVIETVIPNTESGDGPRSFVTDYPGVRNSETNSNRRPAVILMNEPSASAQVQEITFGFEVNEQLLQNEARAVPTIISTLPMPAPEGGYYSLIADNNIVQYLSTAWEETLEKVRSGNARYYEGQ